MLHGHDALACRPIVLAILLGMTSALPSTAVADDEAIDTESRAAFFESHIRPLLVEHCYECHSSGSATLQGGLRVDDARGLLDGGDSGAAVVPGDPQASLLVSALRYEDFEMPPDGQLSDREIAAVEKWIASGAYDPRQSGPLREPSAIVAFAKLTPLWSLQPTAHVTRPQVEQTNWPRNDIDWFMLRRMEERELTPAARADRRTLIRRLSFDLVGLPPTPNQVAEFEADRRPDAYARLVEQLLASPQYGERWARLWLDIARYAEDQAHIVGDDRSLCYPNAYLYRDWIIQALNGDMPYDEFLRQQLAADLLPDNEANHVALGFLGLGPKYYNRGAAEVKADEWDDRIDAVSRGLLGLTVACARCHDHKFDPITMHDYYALAGVFASTRMYNAPLDSEREVNQGGDTKQPDDAMHIVREGKATDVAIAIRGNVKKPGPIVPRGFMNILGEGTRRTFAEGSGRLELAEAIVDARNPLTARVIVNRIWAAHFGEPLVATPSNFGHMGQPPTHPELLDDLAARFVAHGWSLKWLHREIVCSATYQQASCAEPHQLAIDPDNRWLSRMNRRRLEVEQWRDAMLAVTTRLDEQLGGASINPAASDSARRTVYAEISRFQLNPFLARFDFPDPNAHAPRRVRTTTPLQKLFLMNSDFVVGQASSFAARIHPSFGAQSLEARINQVYRELFQREATEEERALAVGFLQGDDPSATGTPEAFRDYVQALFVSNEMFFID